MTRFSLLFIAFTCIATVACKGKQTSGETPATDTTTTDSTAATPNQPDTVVVKTYSFDKSDKYASISVKVQLPTGTDQASAIIRSTLLETFDKNFAFDWEGNRLTPIYQGGFDDANKCIPYYIKAHLKTLSAEAKQTNEDMQNIDEIQQSSDDVEITKQMEIGSLVEFSIVNSVYNAGAAHPSTVCSTALFNKQSGKEVSKLLVKGAEKKMQKLLIKGLIQYFSDFGEKYNEQNIWEQLQIGGDISEGPKLIPLPQDTPCPQKDGLCFTYGQYEIACYAAGMPSFVIPYDKVKPYLTEEAKQLLGL